MRKQFTVEDYMFVDEMIQETIKAGGMVRLNKLQLLRKKISLNLLADGKYDDLQDALDKAVMSRV